MVQMLSDEREACDPMVNKKEDLEQYQHWCECECSQCEIGAHERCSHKECHMPKWDDLEKKPEKKKKFTS